MSVSAPGTSQAPHLSSGLRWEGRGNRTHPETRGSLGSAQSHGFRSRLCHAGLGWSPAFLRLTCDMGPSQPKTLPGGSVGDDVRNRACPLQVLVLVPPPAPVMGEGCDCHQGPGGVCHALGGAGSSPQASGTPAQVLRVEWAPVCRVLGGTGCPA